ncbi:MAG: AMP-binding protein, partial [Bdellovibrionales bacterium]|nr:AMP-binding protein [Bdellovibrionales bacterium]
MSEISSVLKESRSFKPPAIFSKNSRIPSLHAYQRLRKNAERNPTAFWAKQAREMHWQKPFKKTLEWKFPFAKWFSGGKLNACENALDIHLSTARKNKAAIIWEGEPGDTRTLTYQQLSNEVNRLANGLKSLGVKKGDVVGIYMGMVPETLQAMLACARIGATHNVVFGGFSAEALRDRLVDSKAKILLTQDGA